MLERDLRGKILTCDATLFGGARLKVARFHQVHGGEPRVAGGQFCGAGRPVRGRPETGAPASPSDDPAGSQGPDYAGGTFGAGRR